MYAHGCLLVCLTTLSANTITGYSIENRALSESNLEALMLLKSTLSHLNLLNININYYLNTHFNNIFSYFPVFPIPCVGNERSLFEIIIRYRQSNINTYCYIILSAISCP